MPNHRIALASPAARTQGVAVIRELLELIRTEVWGQQRSFLLSQLAGAAFGKPRVSEEAVAAFLDQAVAHLGFSDERLPEPSEEMPHLFVTTAYARGRGWQCGLVRNYHAPWSEQPAELESFTVKDALQCTTAAPTYLPPLNRHYTYHDGGVPRPSRVRAAFSRSLARSLPDTPCALASSARPGREQRDEGGAF